MNPGLIGLIGGIVGGIIGLAGGLLGTYFSIKNTNGPRERAFVIKASVVCWILVLAFVFALCLIPGLYKLFLILVYFVCLAAGILLWNKKQAQIRLEESKKNPALPFTPPTQIIPRKCPQCGAELKPDVSEGLCPACLLQRGIATEGGAPPGTPPFVPPPIHDLAKLFPQLEILELIGKGGMGAVYKARQPALDRFVALKILAPRSGGDLDFASRFTREARALAKLNHPNIVGVYDFGQADRLSYFIMEYVDGPNLRQVEQAGKLPPREALEIIPQICAALQFAHDEGIVHRDIKPENILLDKKGRVKIADFGLAKILGQEPKDFRLTGARDVMGTPHYMAPEQVEKPQEVDHRADIYSLGVVFYEMLTGELPLGKFQPPSQKVQVDVRLDEVVLRSLAKEPELRYQQASEVKTRVETIASTDAPASAPAVSTGEILARDYTLNIRYCLRRGWALVRNDFWPLVGMSAFVLVVLSAASSFEVVWTSGNSSGNPSGKTSILGLLLSGPLMGGLYLYFLKKIRREDAGVETAFTGFRQPFPHLVIGGFLASLLTVLGFVCLVLPGVYLFVAWIFTFPLIVERRLDFWPAMRLSRKIISKHWWKFFGFLIVLALINVAGMAACGVGLFITFPVTFAALTYAYEDITGAVKSPAGAFSSVPPITTPAAPTSQPDRFWRRFAVVMVCVILIPVAIAIVGLFAAIAIPNFVRARQHSQQLAAQQWTKEGWQLWQAQKMDQAAAKFQQAVQLTPDNADAWNGLGWATFNAGKSQEAEQAFQKAISLDTNQPGALNGLGQINLSRRLYDQAETYLLRAAPQAPAACYGLTRLYLLEGKFDQAETWAQKLVDSGQADDLARQMLQAAREKHLSEGLRFRIEPPAALSETGRTPAGSTSTNSVPASTAVESAANYSQTVAGLPPVVVETWPVSGARDVEPGVVEIRVRFSKAMADGGWSWSTAWQDSTPESVGNPNYEPDHRTCVLKVKLEPGRTYAWWLNSDQFKNFTDPAGRPAVPYLLIFQTKQN
jgi:serine/threonine protein kinase/cytochrome c-type biogenesis protein CcmH/NrfG